MLGAARLAGRWAAMGGTGAARATTTTMMLMTRALLTTHATAAMAAGVRPVQRAVEAKLQEALQPTSLHVENESGGHNVPPGSESHFKVTVVSDAFGGKSLVQRHRLVYSALEEEMRVIHALTMQCRTPEEAVEDRQSPNCLGGSKS